MNEGRGAESEGKYAYDRKLETLDPGSIPCT